MIEAYSRIDIFFEKQKVKNKWLITSNKKICSNGLLLKLTDNEIIYEQPNCETEIIIANDGKFEVKKIEKQQNNILDFHVCEEIFELLYDDDFVKVSEWTGFLKAFAGTQFGVEFIHMFNKDNSKSVFYNFDNTWHLDSGGRDAHWVNTELAELFIKHSEKGGWKRTNPIISLTCP